MMIYNLQYNIDIRPNNDGFTLLARLIKDDFPYSLNHPSTPITDETQWLVHWYAYKPNFKAHPTAPSTNNFGLNHFCDVCHTTRLGIEEKSNIIAQYIAQWLERKNIFPKKYMGNN
ncbi:MAG: hypothetical protein ACP5UA_00915 [Candidatus Hydrogenedens sp.]